jgi:hypothetical protein
LITGESWVCAAAAAGVAGVVGVGAVGVGIVGVGVAGVGVVGAGLLGVAGAPAVLTGINVILGGRSGVVALSGIMNPFIEPSVYPAMDPVIV